MKKFTLLCLASMCFFGAPALFSEEAEIATKEEKPQEDTLVQAPAPTTGEEPAASEST